MYQQVYSWRGTPSYFTVVKHVTQPICWWGQWGPSWVTQNRQHQNTPFQELSIPTKLVAMPRIVILLQSVLCPHIISWRLVFPLHCWLMTRLLCVFPCIVGWLVPPVDNIDAHAICISINIYKYTYTYIYTNVYT